LVPNEYNFDMFLNFFEHNKNIQRLNIINEHNIDTI